MSTEASKKPKDKGIPVIRDGRYRLKKRSKTKKDHFLEFIHFKAQKYLRFAIARIAKRAPKEQHDEMAQDAILKILELFSARKIKRQHWRTYIRTICVGTVLDYLKLGKGFEDGPGWLRFENMNSEDDEISIDQLLSFNGKVTVIDPHEIKINWDLLSRMASRDKWLECFLRQIRSDKLREISPIMGVSVSRVDQYINEFIERFDDPKDYDNPWVQQIAYGLGIAELLKWPNRPVLLENGEELGGGLPPIDLDAVPEHENVKMKDAQQAIGEVGEFKIPLRIKELREKFKVPAQETAPDTATQQSFDLH